MTTEIYRVLWIFWKRVFKCIAETCTFKNKSCEGRSPTIYEITLRKANIKRSERISEIEQMKWNKHFCSKSCKKDRKKYYSSNWIWSVIKRFWVILFLQYTYNNFHNILRLFNVLPNFLITTSEAMHDYYLKTRYIWVASQVAEKLKTEDLRKLGNIRKVSKLHKMIALSPIFLPKWKFFQY